MRCAVITPVAGRHSHLQLQRTGLLAGTLRPDRHIVVTMQDGAIRNLLDERAPPVDIVETTRQAGALPLARARNLGAQQAMSAEADLLIFLDVDCVPGPMLVSRYVQHAAQEMRPSSAARFPTCHRRRAPVTRSHRCLSWAVRIRPGRCRRRPAR